MNGEGAHAAARRAWAVRAAHRYWPHAELLIAQLPMPEVDIDEQGGAPTLREVILPPWAEAVGVERALLVPAAAVVDARGEEGWRRVDWLTAMAWYLDASAERAHEQRAGTIHSYSSRLDGWDPRLWSRAWVNRIALFLRRWAAREHGRDEAALCGPLPTARVVLTHDVDALSKTLSIRLKQAAFQGFNALRALRDGDFTAAARRARKFTQVLLSNESYWCFERIFALEQAAGADSMFFFHARDAGPRGARLMLLDPAYHGHSSELSRAVAEVRRQGAAIGLHPSFAAWRDDTRLAGERRNLEALYQQPVVAVRQHWLRFSWHHTWAAQARAGLRHDYTVAFNDRPGFRLGAALTFRPLAMGGEPAFEVTPTVMMDSQFYDYAELSDDARVAAMAHWLREIEDTHGEAAVIWHQQVFNRDYGWEAGYAALLSRMGAHP